LKKTVGVTTKVKIRGFREYLVMESNPRRAGGRVRLYHYQIPKDRLKEVLEAGRKQTEDPWGVEE